MPQIVEITSSKFFTQPINGETFAASTSDFTTNLVGNVREKIKHEVKFKVYWYDFADANNTWVITNVSPGVYYMTRTIGSWLTEGFAVGDNFMFDALYSDQQLVDTTTAEFTGTITGITPNGQRIDFTLNLGAVTVGNRSDVAIVAYVGSGTSSNEFNAGYFNFGLIENDEPFNTISKVSEKNMSWYGTGFFTPGGTITWKEFGLTKDWVTGAMTSTVAVTNGVGEFTVNHEFTLLPSILAGEEDDVTNLVAPDYFDGPSCLKYVFKVDFRPVASSPRIVTSEFDLSNGFTGWFNQNLNGLSNDYTVVDVSYEDVATTDDVSGLQALRDTKVTIEISKTGTAFASGDIFILYHERYPNLTSEYIDTSTDYTDNFMYQTVLNTIDAAITSNGNWTNVSAVITAGNLVITANYEPTTAQKQRILDDDSYLLTVTHQVAGETNEASTRVMIPVSNNDYVTEGVISGLTTFNNLKILRHNEEQGVDPGLSSINSWNEDGVLIDFEFQLDKTKEAIMSSMDFILFADNGTNTFELDKFSVDVSDSVIGASDVQQINIDSTRGYLLPEGDQFNAVRIFFDSISGSDHIYKGYVGVKIRWEDWIKNSGVDGVFYDNTKLNDNLNYKSSNYAGISGYTLKIKVVANSEGLNSIGVVKTGLDESETGTVNVYDYNVNDDGQITSGTLTLYDSETGQQVTEILNNKDTKVRIDWATPVVFNDKYAIHRLQKNKNNTQSISELSSIRPNLKTILKPVSGDYLNITLLSGVIRTESIIDHTQLEPGVNYDISGFLEGVESGNRSIYLDGINELINCGNDSSTDIERNVAFSMSAAVKFVDVTATQIIMARWGTGTGFHGYGLYVAGGKIYFYMQGNSGGPINRIQVGTSTTISSGVWYNIVVTKTTSSLASGVKIYVDQVNQSLDTPIFDNLTVNITNTHDFSIGARYVNSNNANSYSKDLAIYNKELSASEILELADPYNCPVSPEATSFAANVISYWPVQNTDDLTATTGIVEDVVGVNDGTPINTEVSDLSTDVPC